MDGWKDGRLYPSVEEGTHAHIDKEGRYAHMKGSGRLYQDKEGQRGQWQGEEGGLHLPEIDTVEEDTEVEKVGGRRIYIQ
jgi:hypothetical protein